jgi:hypothetical protein
MKTQSRQGRIEAGNHKRTLRRTLDLSKYQGFDWEPGHYIYNHLGIEVKLRFSQETYEWTAKCPHLKIETSFPHQPPQDIQELLNDWLLTHHTERPTSPEARLRQSTPAVQKLANRHGIPVSVADELVLERGF